MIQKLAKAGLLAAMIFLLTAVVSIPIPGGAGYINLGDAGVLTAAALLGGWWGAACAGIGSALADLFLGFGVYAPATLVIKGGMALLAAFLLKKMPKSCRSLRCCCRRCWYRPATSRMNRCSMACRPRGSTSASTQCSA